MAVAVPAVVAGTSLVPATAADGDESRAAARFLAGQVLNLDLDAVPELGGAAVENIGEDAEVAAYDPLDLAVLETLGLDLGGVELPLTDLIELGAVNQWASADPGGASHAGSGAVMDGEGIGSGGEDFPGDATLNLGDLIGEGMAEAIADVRLELGAISSEAHLEASASAEPAVERAYEVAGGSLVIDVPAIGDLVAGLEDAMVTVEDTVNQLAGPDGAIAGALESLDALAAILDGLAALPLVSVTGPDVTVEVDADLAALLDEILGTPLGEGTGVELDLANGSLVVDLDQLVEGGLNGQEPNTDLLSPEAIAGLTDKVTALLEGLTDQLVEAVTEALRSVGLNISIQAEVSAALINDMLDLSMETTLGALVDGDAEIVDNSTGVVTGVVGPLVADLVNQLVDVVGGLVEETLFGETGVTGTLGETVAPLVDTLAEALAPVGEQLGQLISIQVNSQTEADGAYSVAALTIGLLPAEADGSFTLAKSEVGPNETGEDGDEEGTEDGDEEGTEDGDEEGTEDGDEEGTEDGDEEGTEDGDEEGTEDGDEEGTEDGDEEGTEDGDEEGTEDARLS
ncbi:choice-of-anchor G family protein [Phytoactinopolyspora halotolerans]|uniref:Choice-of-anchor G family protein n=1 Tax=Phytoactinopolyspora halotolerans TaxID=1981512 RepID=A0A6L9S661_9ACTN|nr:choice-of-anchor G family protein [Phytoactinopolyspora halotolerans]NEE00935.1 choice-of-anchor G family protein [Phytoactinopolyspora halotolerans]